MRGGYLSANWPLRLALRTSSLDYSGCGQIGPRQLYEKVYCARGDMENWIKEQQLFLFALGERFKTGQSWSLQTRLYFSSVAYLLLDQPPAS